MLTKIKIFITIIYSLIFGLIFSGLSYAAGPTASLSIAGGTYAPGADFPVTIYENSDTNPVNVVSVTLKFDSTQVQATSVDPSSDLNDVVPPKIASDSVTIVRFP